MCSQVSLKSTAAPGRDGKNLKVNDFKYNSKTYWVTSREAPNVVWMEELLPSTEIVKAFCARDNSYLTTDACYLDACWSPHSICGFPHIRAAPWTYTGLYTSLGRSADLVWTILVQLSCTRIA